MSEKMRVLVTGKISEDDRSRIRAVAPLAELYFAPDIDAASESTLANVDAIAGTVTADVLARAHNLRWVHSWAAGADNDLIPEMIVHPAILTSSVGNGAIPLAEHSIMLMLMLNRDATRWARAQSAKRWDRFTHGELNGLTLGIFGLGHSGADLAAKAQAFHMRVVGLRRNPDRPVAGVDHLYRPDQLHEFLAESDFVVVTAPRTRDTQGRFGASEFEAMKPTAFFICISRGGIVDDDALLTALTDGRIAGAGLDAHGIEPLPSDSPFWALPNVIVTPHNGATTSATQQRGHDIFIDNLRRFVAGDPVVNIVDKHAGY